MSLKIKIENFEGPFDLLLHLIKKNEMDIYDIKIYEITSQYLEYINEMKEMDLEVTSEFIVIAATLLEIKSKLLLPKVKDNDEDGEAGDPRKELILKLVEYKKFKLVAEFLAYKENDIGIVYTKKPEIIEEKTEKENFCEDLLKNVTMLDLYKLYDKLLNLYLSKDNTANALSSEIPADKYKIEDKMRLLLEDLNLKDRILFSDIKKQCENKIEIIVTFLAILELIKLRNIKITQQCNFREIFIERIFEDEEI